MKKLVRTVPIPKGDDSALHDDIMDFDIQMIKEKELNRFKDCVCGERYKKKILNESEVFKECKEQIDKVMPFNIPKED